MKLSKIALRGYKSISPDNDQVIPFGDVTVLIGANGSGKSNLVSFFQMLNFMTTGALQNYVGRHGANQLLHYGSKTTQAIDFELHFAADEAVDIYQVKLSHGLPDRLFVSGEKVSSSRSGRAKPLEYSLAVGGPEIGIGADKQHLRESKRVFSQLSKIRTYQFNDTSETAKIKDRGYVDDARYLRSDAGNLAAFLKRLKESPDDERYYQRIVHHVRRVMPQFGDFSLDTLPGNSSYTRLNWTDCSGNDYLFGPDQLSDGSLRFMALATLLLQPPALLPKFIVLDEAELGLHPAAIAQLAGMIGVAAKNAQVLVATQSTRLVDEFSVTQLVVVERDTQNNSSVFRALDPEALGDWLDRYSLSTLWEKNVLGGQP